MAVDINNNYRGDFYGKDRLGFTTPDVDASPWERPFLPVAYPAPWLPGKRRDDAHPVGAQVVLSTGNLVGLDKSGALIPAGYWCGQSAVNKTTASIGGITYVTGGYSIVVYGQDDVGFAVDALTGQKVAVAGQYEVLGVPANPLAYSVGGSTGDLVLLPDGTSIPITSGDISNGEACTLIPGGYSRPVGYAVRNVWQYLGGVNLVTGFTDGVQYTLDGVNPIGFRAHNYMHEMGTAIQTKFVIRVPYIGATPGYLQSLAAAQSVTGAPYYYTQTDFSRSFTHFTGTLGNSAGDLFAGCSVKASNFLGDAGSFAPWNSATDPADQICGKVLGVEAIYPILDYQNRVRTQFERNNEQIGPFREPNSVIGLMGGSATRGIDYQINLATNGLFRLLKDIGKAITDPALFTYVYVHVSC